MLGPAVMSDQHLSDTTFHSLKLPDVLLRGLQEAGFEYCTPIQALSLPEALQGRDVAGQAQTGTGKTAAFLLATFSYLMANPAPEGRKPTQPRAVILAPTRELAIQIERDAEVLGQFTDLKRVLVYGGTGYDSQRKQLEDGVDILIGTPGRLIDYFKQNIFDLKQVQVMVLDEADRMFDLGFIKDIRYLFHRMPPPTERLGMLFSATLSHRVAELAYDHMNTPVEIKVETDKITADKVEQQVYHTGDDEKIPLLVHLLQKMGDGRALIFCNTKHVCEQTYAWLEGNDIKTGVLSGDVPQNKRQRLLQDFSENKISVLIATDVAARGLHIPDVSHVINFDLPQDAEDYVHRIGRTARAGASGDAISFACERYAYSLMDIEEYIQHKISVTKIEPDMLTKPKPPARIERYSSRDRKQGDRRPPRQSGRPGSQNPRRDGKPGASRPRTEALKPRSERPDTPKAPKRKTKRGSGPLVG